MVASKQIFYLEVWFEGRVQGVGFRYSTCQVASGFEVCGQVSNLLDGRVYLQVEGEEPEVRAFLEELQSEMKNFINKSETQEHWVEKRQFQGFKIGRTA